MELKIFKNTVPTCGGRWESRLEIPVETEILVPDYQPAVFKIVKCLIEPVVLQNRVNAGRWQGEGYLRCTVYYQSDETGSKLCRVEQKFSFEKSAELPEGTWPDAPATLWGETEYCNCRCISEHRIDIRAAFVLAVSLFGTQEMELLTALADCGIEQRTQTLTGVIPVAAEERQFTVSDQMPLPGDGGTILDISGVFSPESATVQTGQVNCKGVLTVQVCYRESGAEALSVRTRSIPILQTMEMAGAAEGDQPVFWGEMISAVLTADEGKGDPTLTVTWKLHLEVWRGVSYISVADAYSTLCDTKLESTSCRLLRDARPCKETVQVALEDELPDAGMEVMGCFVTLSAARPTAAEAADTVKLAGKGTAHVLCVDERGEMTCFDKSFAWQMPGTWQGAAEELAPHLCASATRVSAIKNGTSLRFEAELSVAGTVLQIQKYEVVSAVELGEEFPDKADGPALWLYYAAEGERLFDIARRYHARARDLVAANHLEDGCEKTAGAVCLLIPAAL